MIKVVTVCGAGVGSSMMMRLFTQQILDAEGIDGTVDASDIGSVDPSAYDLVITTSDFADALRETSDKAYLKDQLMQHINQMEG